MKLINDGSRRTIQLATTTCNKTVELVRLNETAIEYINRDKEINSIDGTLIVGNPSFIGDQINSRLEFNEQSIKYLIINLLLPT